MALTAIADEFGGEIPCAPYASNEGNAIGISIVENMNQAPAILLEQHGVFSWGSSPMAALKAAAMTEDVAKTISLAEQIGETRELPKAQIALWHDRYQNRYGQAEPQQPTLRRAA